MRTSVAPFLVSLFLTLALSSAACTDDSKIVASCLMGTLDDGSSLCRDVPHGDIEKGKQFCEILSGISPSVWSEKATCDRSAALGGCKHKNGSIIWVYPSTRHTTVEDAKAQCKETFLPSE